MVQSGGRLQSSPTDDQQFSFGHEDIPGMGEEDEIDDSGMDVGLETESDDGEENEGEPDSDMIVLDPEHVCIFNFSSLFMEGYSM